MCVCVLRLLGRHMTDSLRASQERYYQLWMLFNVLIYNRIVSVWYELRETRANIEDFVHRCRGNKQVVETLNNLIVTDQRYLLYLLVIFGSWRVGTAPFLNFHCPGGTGRPSNSYLRFLSKELLSKWRLHTKPDVRFFFAPHNSSHFCLSSSSLGSTWKCISFLPFTCRDLHPRTIQTAGMSLKK